MDFKKIRDSCEGLKKSLGLWASRELGSPLL